MDKSFKAALILLITALIFAVLLLAYAAQNNTVRVGVKHTENAQGEADSSMILVGEITFQ